MSIKKDFFAPLASGLGATRRAAMLLVMMLTTTAAWNTLQWRTPFSTECTACGIILNFDAYVKRYSHEDVLSLLYRD
jgi:hypothetical protein